MKNIKAFTLYYLLPFSIYIVFAALQAASTPLFWGMVALGSFFMIAGYLLMQQSLITAPQESSPHKEPALPVAQEPQPSPLPAPVVIDLRKEKEFEEKLRSKEEELLALRSQLSALQADLTKTDEQIKTRDATIQELRFEVRSLLAISRGKSAPVVS